MSEEYSGGSVSYYTCSVTHPINEQADPYDAECIDIIDALRMTPSEANAFKALWRRAAARLGKSKRGYTDGLYDAEKVEFYGKRLVELETRERRAAGAVQVLDWGPTPPPRDELIMVEGLDLPVTKTWAENTGATPALWPRELYSDENLVPKLVPAADPFGPRDADGWYTWNGDDTMRPAGQVEYWMRGGVEGEIGEASGLRWSHCGDIGDIVKWRPAINR